jgi:biotin carboxylase
MTKTLWIVSGGIEAVPGIQLAKKMGLNVVVSDGNPNAPGFRFADTSIVVSTYDIEGTVKAAKKYDRKGKTIDGVICMASDVPLTVARIAEELGLPGIKTRIAEICTDKLLMKEHLFDAGMPIPWFSSVESTSKLRSLVLERGLPLVIKPVDSRGARGVIRITPEIDLNWAFNYAKNFSLSSRVMIEEFLSGPQYSTESIFINGDSFTPGFCERNYEYLDRFKPFIIENGGQQPAKIDDNDKKSIIKVVEKASKSLGISTGTTKGDMVLTDKGPKIIEIAPRLSGGWFSSDQIPLATGVNLIELAIRLCLSDNIKKEELKFHYQKGVAIRYFFPKSGKITEINNLELYKNTQWIHKLKLFVKIGDIIEKITDHTKRCGFVITTGETRDKAVKHANEVVNKVEIQTV